MENITKLISKELHCVDHALALFLKEKKANEQREITFYSELTKSVSELQQEQNDSTNHLNESISGGFDEINSLIDDVLKR